MPPFLPRKRLASTPPSSPRATPLSKRHKLSDTLDAEHRRVPNLQAIRDFTLGEDDSDSDSSLSDVDSEELEDVVLDTTKFTEQIEQHDEDEDVDWEDAIAEDANTTNNRGLAAGGDLQLTFSKDDVRQAYDLTAAASRIKKGPSRREKEFRMTTHRIHVQYLLYHNAVRNKWICSKVVQEILVKQLPAGVKKEIERWRVASGMEPPSEPVKTTPSSSKNKKRGKRKIEDERSQRDWGKPSQRMEKGKPDLSRGDPIIPLMKVLSAYWKKRFAITAPGLRKRGYRTKIALQQDIASYRNDRHDAETHGERIATFEEFKDVARNCEGSRDVGAQLFTALLRGLGIDSRLVASLQASGFGFTKVEQAAPKKMGKPVRHGSSGEESDEEDEKIPLPHSKAVKALPTNAKGTRKSQGNRRAPIDLDSSDDEEVISDDASVMDVTPSMPKQKPTRFDQDLPYPIYWTEVISPISHIVLPVSPLVLDNPVAITPETVLAFEPRGAKAEKGKQVMAYVIAHSSDGTAKDVTTRYLKRHMWPGKTKGFRVPVEQIPIRNARGKVKRYEEYDWFKTVMSGYVRTEKLRTAVDDVEDSSDLVPKQLEKKESKDDGDTLQSLKQSADFVLERFLRREEALRPEAMPDRTFVSGKGDKLKEEPIYRRSDVERCMTAESWHKEGRRPKAGAVPMKQVAVRAVTLTRKREIQEAERQTGEKPTQGLYARDQTEYIIPPPIKNGVIPKNAYNNIDCFVPSMVPKGAVHIPLKGTVRICKRLEIDYAEAVTGFEFGNKMAIPVITGVVVAEENRQSVKEAWDIWNAEQKKKEEGKLEKTVLALWRKFVMGLRINERLEEAYGEDLQENMMHADVSANHERNVNGGPSEERGANTEAADSGGGFFLPHEDDEQGGELIMEHEEASASMVREVTQYPTPTSIPSVRQKSKRKSLLRSGSRTSDTSDLSSSLNDSESSAASDEDEQKDEPEQDIVKKKKRKCYAPLPKEAVSKKPSTPRLGSRKSTRAATKSPYFDEKYEHD